MVQQTLGFLGFGNMGMAIAGGLLEKGTVASRQVMIFDTDEAKREAAERMGIGVADSHEQLVKACDVLVLATKPQGVSEAMDQIKSAMTDDMLLISICAGISIAYFQDCLGSDFRVVRVMPNTPALVSAGAAGIALSPNCTEADGQLARAIFEAIGIVELVSEEAIDAVTALSGSGPAYFFYMVECLVKAAVHEGLDKEQATRLASQTLLGAARLLTESGEPAGVLRDRVTSRGGTTAAALQAFMEHGFEAIIQTGVAAAAARSRELGQ